MMNRPRTKFSRAGFFALCYRALVSLLLVRRTLQMPQPETYKSTATEEILTSLGAPSSSLLPMAPLSTAKHVLGIMPKTLTNACRLAEIGTRDSNTFVSANGKTGDRRQ